MGTTQIGTLSSPSYRRHPEEWFLPSTLIPGK